MTTPEEIRGRAIGFGRALLKSAAIDPDRRVARHLLDELEALILGQLPEDAQDLRDLVSCAVGTIALLTAFAADTIEEAKAQGASLTHDPADFATRYDSQFAVEEFMDELDAGLRDLLGYDR